MLPDCYRVRNSRSYVIRYVRYLVLVTLRPPMLVLFSDLRALWIMVIPAQIKSVDTTCSLQNERVSQYSGGCVVTAVHEHRQSARRFYVFPELPPR